MALLCAADLRRSTGSRRRRTRSSWPTTTRRRRSITASPISSATACSWPSRPPRSSQSVIVQCGVHFMAETSKLLNPDKTVLIPDSRAGCSLASSITAEDVLAMRAQYPGVPVVTYVNTSAAVKAVTDVCCTSSNAARHRQSRRRRHGDHDPRPVPGAEHRQEDQQEGHHLGRRLRGARDLHRRRHRRTAPRLSDGQDHRPSRMPARGDRRGGFCRLDRRDDRLGQDRQAAARGDGHRVLDVGQRRVAKPPASISCAAATSART